MVNPVKELYHNAWFYGWCRWTEHRGSTWEENQYEKEGMPDIYMRVCTRCDRVLVSDVTHILDMVERELDKYEGVTKEDVQEMREKNS